MSDGKMPNPGWPDPTDWVRRLNQELSERRAIYEQEAKVLSKRKQAGMMLGRVVEYLMELPPFKRGTAVLPLKDLLIFLNDVSLGRDHPWSKADIGGGTNITDTAQSELKLWVRAGFWVLKRNGFKPVEAYRRIAIGLTRTGRTGRAKGPFPFRKVQRWCLEVPLGNEETPSAKRIREKVERWWLKYRADAGEAVGDKELAGEFVERIWSLAHLRDRSVSGASE